MLKSRPCSFKPFLTYYFFSLSLSHTLALTEEEIHYKDFIISLKVFCLHSAVSSASIILLQRKLLSSLSRTENTHDFISIKKFTSFSCNCVECLMLRCYLILDWADLKRTQRRTASCSYRSTRLKTVHEANDSVIHWMKAEGKKF